MKLLFLYLRSRFSHSSDECGRVFAYRKNGTRYEKDNVQVYDRSGRKTTPVWACYSGDGPGLFLQIEGRFVKEKYLDILQNSLLPWIRARFGDQPVRFVHDRSPIHTARVIQQWFAEQPGIEVLPWPSKGADLNPIENIWGDIVKDFDARDSRTSDEVF